VLATDRASRSGGKAKMGRVKCGFKAFLKLEGEEPGDFMDQVIHIVSQYGGQGKSRAS